MFSFGLQPLGAESAIDTFLKALSRLQGEGLASNVGTIRHAELVAWATAFAIASRAIEAAATGVDPRTALELMPDWETTKHLVADALYDLDTRQRRLAVSGNRRLFTNAGLVAALATLGVTASVVTALPDETNGTGVVRTGQHRAVVIARVLQTPRTLALVRELLRRTAGADIGQKWRPFAGEEVVTDVDARWSTAATVIGRSALAPGTTYSSSRGFARTRSYSPHARLAARDLNAMQRGSLISVANGAASSAVMVLAGQQRLAFALSVANGASAQVAPAVFDRLVRVTCRVGTSTTDFRPNSAGDTSFNTQSVVDRVWCTGVSPAGSTYDITLAAGVLLRSSGAGITIENSSGGMRIVCGILELTGNVSTSGGGAKTQDLTTFVDDTAGQLVPSWWTAMKDAIGLRRASGSGVSSWTAVTAATSGGACRLVGAPLLHRPAGGAGARTYVVDTSIDWRDRLLTVHTVHAASVVTTDTALFPGAADDVSMNSIGSAGTLVYTGTGIATGGVSMPAYAAEVIPGVGVATVGIGARSTDGALVIEVYHTSSLTTLSVQLLVQATDRLGARSAASAIAEPATPVAAAPISSRELNVLQDPVVLVPGTTPEVVFSGGTPTALQGFRYGPSATGTPPIPRALTVRQRDGRAYTAPNARAWIPAAGRLRRVFQVVVGPSASVVVDTSADWRDRCAIAYLFTGTSADHYPGNAKDYWINDGGAAPGAAAGYLGAGRADVSYGADNRYTLRVGPTGLFTQQIVYARVDGALMVRNDGIGTLYCLGWIDASFQIGARVR